MHCVHQHIEHVAVVDQGLLELVQHGRQLGGVPGVEVGQALELALLFFVGGAREFQLTAR